MSLLERIKPAPFGINAPHHKAQTSGLDTLRVALPYHLTLLLKQHSGKAALPVVKEGQRVLKGQLLARADGAISAPVHAPTSGWIKDIGPQVGPHPSGLPQPGILLEVDGDDEQQPFEKINPFRLAPEDVAQRVAAAGIVGLGGAAFPSSVKLAESYRKGIDTLIINGAECEPYITCDDRLMQEHANQLIDGALIIQHASGAQRILIGIEDNKQQALAAVRSSARGLREIQVVAVPARYPMGSAKQLVAFLTGREIPVGTRSADAGILVHNVATARAIYLLFRKGLPLISRIVTVAGGAVRSPRNVETLIGSSASFLLERCGGLKTTPHKLLMGGPLMGMALPNPDVPIIKGGNAILALTPAEVGDVAPSPCIRCGRCIAACPMGLLPNDMAAATRAGQLDKAVSVGLSECIQCASCAYVCPARIPLTQYFMHGQAILRQQRGVKRKADFTRQLMAQHDARLQLEAERKAAEKAAKSAARKRRTA